MPQVLQRPFMLLYGMLVRPFTTARSRPGDTNMSLERVGMWVWWQGHSGLKFVNLKEKLSYLNQLEPVPKKFVVDCDCNDIGLIDLALYKLITGTSVRNHVQLIKQRLNESILVWSKIFL